MNGSLPSGPTFFVRAVTTWTADDGAPRSETLGQARVETTRVGRMVAHVVAALPTLAPLRRKPQGAVKWIVASATGPLESVVSAIGMPSTPVRPRAVAPDGAATELAAHLGAGAEVVAVGAGPQTVAMALVEGAAWLAAGAEDAVVVVVESEAPTSLRSTVAYEPLAVAFHLAADPGPADVAMIAGPDPVRLRPPRPAGPHGGSPGAPALALARAAHGGSAMQIPLEYAGEAEDPTTPTVLCMQVKPVAGAAV